MARTLAIVLALLCAAPASALAHALGITHVVATFEGGTFAVEVEAHPAEPGGGLVIPDLIGDQDVVVQVKTNFGATPEPTPNPADGDIDPPAEPTPVEHRLLPDSMLISLMQRDRPVRFDGVAVDATVEMAPPSEDGTPVVRLTGSVPDGAAIFRWHAPKELGLSRVKATTAERGEAMDEWVEAGRPSEPLVFAARGPAPPSRALGFAGWTRLGFVHIVPAGLDHVLFVLGLFLFGAALRPLLLQVTAFTVAHSVTLGLSVAGVVQLPSSVVEPLIALSIAVVAVENLRERDDDAVPAHRLAIVFLFGLLHGAGFAGVIEDIGLPTTERLAAVLGFNVGVELGQIAVLVGAFALVGWARSRPGYRRWVEVPGSLGIAVVGLIWTVQRVLG